MNLTLCSRSWIGIAVLALFLVAGTSSFGQDAAAFLDEVRKADDGGDAREVAKKLVPLVNGAAKEVLEQVPERLKEEYKTNKMSLDWDAAAKVARVASLITLAGLEAKNMALFGNCRMVLWQDLFDLAGAMTMDVEEKVTEATRLAKMWEPLWEDLFAEVKKEHRSMEAKGDTVAMKQYEEQLEVMAKAWEKATTKTNLTEEYTKFKEALEKWKDLPPDKRKVKEEAEAAFERARERLEHKELAPAESILETVGLRKFEEIGDNTGLVKSLILLCKVKEALKKAHEIADLLERAEALATKEGDASLKKEIEAYRDDLKERGVDITKNPFTNPNNLKEEETIPLRPNFNQVRESRPLPQSFDNPFFWRPMDLERGIDEKGNPKNVKKLPFPQPVQYWLIWDEKDVKIATDEKGAGARVCRVGKSSPNKERVTLQYWSAKEEKQIPLPYEFLIVELLNYSICGRSGTFPANPSYMGVKIHSNTHRIGKIGGQKIALIDDNTNGIFADVGTEEKGTIETDHFYWGCDTFVVGSGASAQATLFGGLIQVKDKYYHLKSWDLAGTELVVQEYKGPTGKLELKFNGAPRVTPLHFVMGTSVGGKLGLGFINLGGSRGPVTVPTGSYFFKWGLLCTGNDPEKGERVEIWPNNFRDRFKVEEGQTVTVEFGGPFKIEMPVVAAGNMGELQTYELKVYGAKGEEYKRFWDKPFLADYKIKDANSAVVDSGKLRAYTEQDELRPAGKGIELYLYAYNVIFKIDPQRNKEPYKAEFSVRHPLLGTFQTEGWR